MRKLGQHSFTLMTTRGIRDESLEPNTRLPHMSTAAGGHYVRNGTRDAVTAAQSPKFFNS